jgi:integrase
MGKNKNKLPDVPKTEDVIKFFEAIRIPKLSIACLVGMGCGLRVSESCKIENYDIDFENRRIKIRDGKDPNRAKHGNYGKVDSLHFLAKLFLL